MIRTFLTIALAVALTAVVAAPSAQADTITFAGFSHGQILTTQVPGVTISANNQTRGLTIAGIFDTTESSTYDPDLEDPFSNAGNLSGSTLMGNALILAENNVGASDGILDRPDDEGSRRTDGLNWIQFVFGTEVTELGWDVIDLESISAQRSSIVFTDGDGDTVSIDWYTTGSTTDIETLAGLGFGDNSLNRIAPITAAYLNSLDGDFGNIASARFIVGGSMALDNLTFTSVPEPGTLALLACGLLCIFLYRRSRAIA